METRAEEASIRLVILGSGAGGRELLDLVLAINAREPGRIEIFGFIDDDPMLKGERVLGYPVLGDFGWFDTVDRTAVCAVIGVGAPALKRKLARRALSRGLRFAHLIHPTAMVSPFVTLEEGASIDAMCVVSNGVRVGQHAHLHVHCTLGHDTQVGDFVQCNLGVRTGGGVEIGEGTELGMGAMAIPGIRIGSWSVIGAGCVIVRDLAPNVTAVGVPARVVKVREPGWHESE